MTILVNANVRGRGWSDRRLVGIGVAPVLTASVLTAMALLALALMAATLMVAVLH